METIPHVTYRLMVGGQTIPIDEGGHLTDPMFLITPTIECVVDGDASIIGISVDTKKRIQVKRNHTPDKKGNCYRARVNIRVADNGMMYTKYPDNHMRLVYIKENGEVVIWEIALISQSGDLFLTVQKTWEVQCYKENDTVVCPRFAHWPDMIDLLQERLTSIDPLPEISEYIEPDKPNGSHREGEGRVIWFNLAWGLGNVQTAEGTARVHWSQVEKRDGRAYLLPDEIVQFQGFKNPECKTDEDGNPKRETSFKRELVGVKAL